MELKPCPFCGSEIRIVRLHDSYGEPWYARCDRCEVSGYYYKTEDQAIEEWSVRPERTCRIERIEDEERILHGWMECSECGPVYPPAAEAIQDAIRFCPYCGAKVVE